MEFFPLPDGYDFSDVAEVINHSVVDANGHIVALRERGTPPESYGVDQVLRERAFFTWSSALWSGTEWIGTYDALKRYWDVLSPSMNPAFRDYVGALLDDSE